MMDNDSRDSRPSHLRSSFKHERSYYDTSDTETEWQESVWHDLQLPMTRPKTPDHVRSTSPFRSSQMQSSNEEIGLFARRHSRSPYKPTRHGGNNDILRDSSPFEVSEHRRHVSPYQPGRGELNYEFSGADGSYQRRNQQTPPKLAMPVDRRLQSQLQDASRLGERSNYNPSRSISSPKLRAREKRRQNNFGPVMHGAGSLSAVGQMMIHKGSSNAYSKTPPREEINEVIANMKLSKSSSADTLQIQTTESVAPGDIFFSTDRTDLNDRYQMKDANYLSSNCRVVVISKKINNDQQSSGGTGSFNEAPQPLSAGTALPGTNTSSISPVRQSSRGRISNVRSILSDNSRKLSGSFRKFTVSRQIIRPDAWFSCVKKGPFDESNSPEFRAINEAPLIEKTFIVEEVGVFWADKYRPRSLSEFSCHKKQAQYLKQLISCHNCPHILFKGPSGSGKKSLCRALLHGIFGDSSWKISHGLRYFQPQEAGSQVVVPLTSSPHHVELNLKSESKNARYALMSLVKEITGNHELTIEASDISLKADYTVIVLHAVDEVEESDQEMIKWIMDCYTDACKIILCCEDDSDLLDSLKSRCKLVTLDAPTTHEIMEVLLQIAKKEKFELSVSYAARIATGSNQNMRRAIMALEACKAHNYPFVEEQPIPLDWEEILVELASEILADPSPKRLFFIRGKLQKLLLDYVHPKLILQKLVEQFLIGIETDLKREIYYWQAYYSKRLPTGTIALLKLEEFVLKCMSIYRKSSQLPAFA